MKGKAGGAIMEKKGGRKMKKVEIIGAAIVDVLVSPAEERVFQTGSY